MKKSLLALAVLGAAMSAQAADVQMYGIVDAGISYVNQSTSLNNIEDKDTFGMESGLDSASRVGIKGVEDLGNGMSVSFKLENGFKADSGEFKTSDTLFDREASLSLNTGYGTISFGRMGGLTSSAGTYDLFYAMADSFDGGKNNINTGFKMSSRYDNMITYASPEFAGAQVFAQYSFEASGEESDQVSNNDRYAALGVSYKVGNLGLVGVVDGYFYADQTKDRNGKWVASNAPEDDGMTFNLGANYDFGFMKLFGAFQYAKNVDDLANYAQGVDFLKASGLTNDVTMNNGMDGYALHVGATFPIAAGTLTTAVYYADAEEADSIDARPAAELNYVGVAAQYNYPLSTRTDLYVGAGYSKTDVKAYYGKAGATKFDEDMDVTQFYFGMKHAF